jgi:hypothetical protein
MIKIMSHAITFDTLEFQTEFKIQATKFNKSLSTKPICKECNKRKGSFKCRHKKPEPEKNNAMIKVSTPMLIKPNRKQRRSYPHEVKKMQRIERIQKINDEKRMQYEREQEAKSRKDEKEKVRPDGLSCLKFNRIRIDGKCHKLSA